MSNLGVENLSKRLVNSREGKVVFEKPAMGMEVLMKVRVQHDPAPGRSAGEQGSPAAHGSTSRTARAARPASPASLRPRPCKLPPLPTPPPCTAAQYGRALVEEQDNVKRVQLAEAYMSGAELAGSTGSSMPEAFRSK